MRIDLGKRFPIWFVKHIKRFISRFGIILSLSRRFLQFQLHDHKRQGSNHQVYQCHFRQHKHERLACIQQRAPETRFQEGHCHASTREETLQVAILLGLFPFPYGYCLPVERASLERKIERDDDSLQQNAYPL